MDYRDVDERIRRLPIDASNLRDVGRLLRLPYEQFKPIMDELLTGGLTVRDLRPALRRRPRPVPLPARPAPAAANAASLLAGGPVESVSFRDWAAEDDERAAVASESGVPAGLEGSIAVAPVTRVVTRDMPGSGSKAVQLENARALDAARLAEKLTGA